MAHNHDLQEDFGDNHMFTHFDTPLRADAFELSDEEKNSELKSIQEKIEKTILSYLNPAQKEKYQLLKIQKPDKKEDKKKKKSQEKAEQSEAKETESEK